MGVITKIHPENGGFCFNIYIYLYLHIYILYQIYIQYNIYLYM